MFSSLSRGKKVRVFVGNGLRDLLLTEMTPEVDDSLKAIVINSDKAVTTLLESLYFETPFDESRIENVQDAQELLG